MVFVGVGADNKHIHLTLREGAQSLVKVLTWQEALYYGARLVQEAEQLIPREELYDDPR